jgi:hypothetical protein
VKRKNVFNKTLKKYIPIPVLEYLKEKYLNMRRMRRKQRRMQLIGGDATTVANVPALDTVAVTNGPALKALAPEDEAPAPEVEAPAPEAPATPTPEAPAPEPPAPEAPATPTPEASATPAPEAPTPEAPTPEAPATPAPEAPAPEAPAEAPATAAPAEAPVAPITSVNTSPSASSQATSIAIAAVSAAQSSVNNDKPDKPGKEGTEATAEGTSKEGTDSTTEKPDVDNKKGGGFSLGPDIPGDISIHSETHELKDLKLTWKLLQFLVKSCIPYYIQLELKDKLLNKHDTDIFDLRRILYGKYVTQEILKKAGDKQKLYFKPGSEIGIADGDSISGDNNTDVFIFTGEKVSFDPKSKENAIKLITAPKTPNEKSFVVTDSKRLYQLSGDGPSSIDSMEDVGILGGNSIDISEFRLQVAPLSEADLKSAVATASSSDGDKKKRKKTVTDDTNSYVVNLSMGCKVTSIQTLRKSLEVARVSLEDEDDVSKNDAMDIIKMINELLENPEFAKNDGFAEFKEKVFGFSYKIPGSERKYGIAQMMTFFDQEKDNLPPDLAKAFFMMLTLLGHGPAGENGACLAFDRPQSLEVIEYTKTLANGDIVTTKKLGSKMNLEGLGSEIDKLNASNEPKEEGEKKEGEKKDGKEEGDDAKKAAAADSEAEGVDSKKKTVGADNVKDKATLKAEGAEGADSKATSTVTNEESAKITPPPHDNTSPPTANDVEEIDAESIGTKYKAYIIKHFKFPTTPEMVLVHFMGWGLGHDEIMALKDPKISKRTSTSKEGPRQSKVNDLTKEEVIKLYTVDQIKTYSEKAEKMSKELFAEDTSRSNSISIAAVATSTAKAKL